MFNWNECPSELFDMYIEVGGIKESSVKSEECVFIELWISTVFSTDWHRYECKSPVRVPIYDVLKQIRKLCGAKAACMIIMCDDVCYDTMNWGISLSLLLQQLEKEKILKHSLIYTKMSSDEVEQLEQTTKWRKNSDKEKFLLLFDMLDVLVFEQANCYSKQKNIQIQSKTPEPPLLLSTFIRLANN